MLSIGLSFSRIREPVYKELTLEFLSSLRLNFKPTVPGHRDVICFKCVGINRELDMRSMSAIFYFQDVGYKSIEWQQTVYDPIKF